MKHISSYPSIYNIGHKYVLDIFQDSLEITSKIDGSQISFGRIDGELCVRSKGQDLIIDAPEKMFNKAVEVIKTLDLKDNYIYRGEYLKSPKHNTLAYSRIPNNHIILYNIEKSDQNYLTYEEMVEEGKRVGLEVVPLIYRGKIESLEQIKGLLNKESYLGGCLEEGIVLKAYNKFGQDKKILMAKLVREEFKEIHQKEWKITNPGANDILSILISKYKTDARYSKAIQHLRDNGQLTVTLRDIPNLIKECQSDIKKEEEENIKQELFNYFWPKIQRSVVSGIPQFYKDYLANKNFNDNK